MSDAVLLHLSLPVDDLEVARDFYVRVLGCRVGRERNDWFDVWFFGLQLTLHLRPEEVVPPTQQGVRHFGVVLPTQFEFDALVARVNAAGGTWLSEPEIHSGSELSGKLGGKLADPSGNVIEIKFYEDRNDLLS